jgi:ubiquinone/menaquinone biosynthesis C-methylase UbiE
MSQPASHYVHGTDPDEQRRLSILNDILNAGSLRELQLRGGESILDLGCGLGQLTRAMARAAGTTGRVLGIDRSEEQLARARQLATEPADASRGSPAAIEFRQGDVLDLRLDDHEWGTFDVAHARFLLEHLPDPLTVVRSMVRAVKPGGRIVLEDDDHEILRLWPEPAGFGRVWGAYMDSYRRAGNDPSIGKRLVELLHQAGARPRRSTFIYFGACSGEPVFPTIASNLIGVLRGAKTALLAGGLEKEEVSDCLEAIQEWGTRSDAAKWYAMSWAEGVRVES